MDKNKQAGISGGKVMLIAFYNTKALGVRFLQTALEKAGYETALVFFKGYNSVNPRGTTETELSLLRAEIAEAGPMLIGLSVMSSMYLETADRVLSAVTGLGIPVVCGGAFATMFPGYFLSRGANFVIRGDGERPLCRLADAVRGGLDPSGIPSLCLRRDGRDIIKAIGDICGDIDEYGIPAINSRGAVLIENDALKRGDPQLGALSYEVAASRGCPFTCSYCCCVNLRRLLPAGTRAVRTRSVGSVIEELETAKRELKKLVFIHFYDEIFPNTPGWVDEFAAEYKKRVGLPFAVWSHPKTADETVLRKLVSAGLEEVVMGIQSGSERIRRDIFHRYETEDEILRAAEAVKRSGVFRVSYDFMVRHPFESYGDLMETCRLVKKLPLPFGLQLHGLNFLPGTDIVSLALEAGLFTAEEMEKIMYAPMSEQFGAYWEREGGPGTRALYRLIYCQQFSGLRGRLARCEADAAAHEARIGRLYALALRMAKLRRLREKAHIALKSLI